MNFNLRNMFQFLAYITPFLLGFTFLLLAAMNGNVLQAVVYFGILVMTSLVVSMLKINNGVPLPAIPEVCKTWGWNFFDDAYYRPSLSTYFISFTLMYVLTPMLVTSNVNWFLFSFMTFVYVLEMTYNFGYNKCYTLMSFVLSTLLGVLFGGGSGLLLSKNAPEMIFFGDKPSNKATCGKVSNRNFKCVVYKNGQLIKSI